MIYNKKKSTMSSYGEKVFHSEGTANAEAQGSVVSSLFSRNRKILLVGGY